MSFAVQKHIYICTYISCPCNQSCRRLIKALCPVKAAGLCINMDQHTSINLKEQTGELKNTGMKGRLGQSRFILSVCLTLVSKLGGKFLGQFYTHQIAEDDAYFPAAAICACLFPQTTEKNPRYLCFNLGNNKIPKTRDSLPKTRD